MLASLAQPILAFPVAVIMAALAAGAVCLHVLRGTRRGWRVPAGLFVLAVAAGVAQPLALRVIALPSARALPVDRVAGAEVLATFPPGLWLESLAVAPDGTIYLAANMGLDLLTGDRTHAVGQVLRRGPDGVEEVLLTLPQGVAAGGLALDAEGTLYLAALGRVPGITRVVAGQGAPLADLPAGAWPNGMAFGPDDKLYVADSALGRIWRVDPASGAVAVAVDSEHLRARPWIALAPGANGVAFDGGDLIVTVSDRATVLRFARGADGSFAAPEVLMSGVPGDDLAIDQTGVLYVTTHPYDTVVRIATDGSAAIIAGAGQSITGATDAAFGTRPGDTGTLYVTTDGGAFAGNPDAAGRLVALRLR
jgi:sugar lactone lactonase YvrE